MHETICSSARATRIDRTRPVTQGPRPVSEKQPFHFPKAPNAAE
jgi:hypothetical protein